MSTPERHLLNTRPGPRVLCDKRAQPDDPTTQHLDEVTCPGCLASLAFALSAQAPKAGCFFNFDIGAPARMAEDAPGEYRVEPGAALLESESFQAKGPHDAARQYGEWLVSEGGCEAREFDDPLQVEVTGPGGEVAHLLIGPVRVELEVEVKEAGKP